MTNVTHTPHYGATPGDWDALTLIHGLTADLLPVVSNPTAEVSPRSVMRDIGKVPSRYNNMKLVTGFAHWTEFEAGMQDIAKWRAQPDYGICIQTRHLRAIDIDVTDPVRAGQIVKAIDTWFKSDGIYLPRRTRANSSKLLMAFYLPGTYAKRVAVIERKKVNDEGEVVALAQAIEFLANGQQFIAAGTHPSGSRYMWGEEDAIPLEFPTLTPEQFEGLWTMLERTFAAETTTGGVLRKRGAHQTLPDPTLEALERNGLVLGYGRDGQAFIQCPWKHEHSSDSGISETAYFPRGTNGYERGHFKCLHASHAGKKDEDYETALGLLNDMFEVLPPEPDSIPMPSLRRNKIGQIEGTISQISKALTHPVFRNNWRIAYDEFIGEPMVDKNDGDGMRPLANTDFTALAVHLEVKGFKSCSIDLMRKALLKHAADNRYDSAVDWLKSLPAWDGTPRIAKFMTRYYSTADTPYNTALGRYWWTAMVGRILRPGAKADMMPVLYGLQGTGKSTSLPAMLPSESWFLESDFHGIDGDDQKRKIRGAVLVEFAEMSGMGKREKESIKKYLSSTSDRWIEKYETQRTEYLRRCVFVGTTNENELLSDHTGERRFLPTEVGEVDVAGIQRDRDQLWAEAFVMYKENGIMWQDAQSLAKDEHEKYKIENLHEQDVKTLLFAPDSTGVAWIEQQDRIVSLAELMSALYPFAKVDAQLRRSVKAALMSLGARPALRRRPKGGVVRGYEFAQPSIERWKSEYEWCDLV